jgi:hypothetical protein
MNFSERQKLWYLLRPQIKDLILELLEEHVQEFEHKKKVGTV